jgi:hypothetical protein
LGWTRQVEVCDERGLTSVLPGAEGQAGGAGQAVRFAGELASRRLRGRVDQRTHHGQLIVYANALGRAFRASWAAFGL